jgi:hypothetical protein
VSTEKEKDRPTSAEKTRLVQRCLRGTTAEARDPFGKILKNLRG